jgi:hypothetical protein
MVLDTDRSDVHNRFRVLVNVVIDAEVADTQLPRSQGIGS